MISKGKIASFAKKKRNNIIKKYSLMLLLLVCTSSLSLVVLLNSSSTLHYVAAALGAGISIFIVIRLKLYGSDLAKLSAGIGAEAKVARSIMKYKGDFLINGAILGKIGDCDHIVLGPICAVVETKYGRGPVSVDNGQVFVKNRPIKSNPIQQVKRQAQVLSRIYNIRVNTIICISEGFFKPFTYEGVVLCNAQDLPKVLELMPKSISKEKAYPIYNDIKIQD